MDIKKFDFNEITSLVFKAPIRLFVSFTLYLLITGGANASGIVAATITSYYLPGSPTWTGATPAAVCVSHSNFCHGAPGALVASMTCGIVPGSLTIIPSWQSFCVSYKEPIAPVTSCPANSVIASPTSCSCNIGYKPSNIASGIATACILQSAAEPSKNVAQPCTNTPASTIASTQQNACTNPINSGTGGKHQREGDYSGVGPYPLIGDRNYDSGGATLSAVDATVWGSQWRSTYDRLLSYASNGVISAATVKRADGKQYYFTLIGTSWVGDADIVGSLVRLGVDAAGNAIGWIYTNEHDEVETYDAAGKLTTISNRAGLTQTLSYSDGTAGANGGYVLDAAGVATAVVLPAGKLIRVTDPAGHTLQYGYDTAGRVVKMTDPAGGSYLYSYSDTTSLSANLTSVKYPDGKVRTYLYGETANVSATPATGVSYVHALTGIIDENGNRYASWTYDAQGRATSSEHGTFGSGIDHVGLTYTAPDANGNSSTSVTDPRGNVRTYTFSTLLGVVKNTGITGQPCNGCSAAFTYDSNGNVASRTDFKGNTTCYSYDLARNLETVRIEGIAAGTACPANLSSYVPSTAVGSVERKTTTQWHATLRLPLAVAEPLRLTTYTYDTQGNLLSRSTQATTDTTGGAGLAAATSGTARTTSYTYNTAGQILTIDGSRTDVADITRYSYDVQGNLATVTNALNQQTALGNYDANGRPGTLTDPNGQIASLSYDARGRLITRSSGTETTRYTYDGVGQLIGVSAASGANYTYTYDAAHRLTDITDNLGNRISYTLDAMGNRTKEQTLDAAGNIVQTHSRTFDALNRLYQDIGAINQTTTYAYDANGNLTNITDPLNRQSTRSYDALNRLVSNTDAAAGNTRYGYDGQDQLLSVTDPKNLTTQYQRDGLGNLTQQTSPDTGITVNTYDAAGNVLTRTDAKGQIASYTYDALNRLTGIRYSGGTAPAQTVSYQYDQGTNGIGHLTGLTDMTGTTAYSYDTHGRLTGETRQPSAAPTTTYTTAYSYDPQGRLTSITYPSGRTVNYTLDGLGRINQIATTYNATTKVLTSNISYEPFGGVHSFTYGDGTSAPVQTYVRQRDQDGRIASYTLNGKPIAIGYDIASQISFIADPLNLANTANYSYDPLSRLTGYTQNALSQNYGYDADGNRLTQTIGATTTNYGYAPGSNRLASIQVGTGIPQPLTQDAVGATTSDATRQYTYDTRGRLIQTTTAQGVINYEVNALGLRTRKQVPYSNTDTQYYYDVQGHLIGESPTGSSQFTREYIYLGDQPVAVMQ